MERYRAVVAVVVVNHELVEMDLVQEERMKAVAEQ